MATKKHYTNGMAICKDQDGYVVFDSDGSVIEAGSDKKISLAELERIHNLIGKFDGDVSHPDKCL